MIREAIARLVTGASLTEAEASAAMVNIMSGEATPAQIGAFLVALRMKGEKVDEIAGMARVMREHARRVEFPGALLDTCGTGGDERGTFNVSTAAAFVAAGAGARVAKHGNRAMTSRCGSADVLEALGARIDLGPEQVRQCLDEVGVGFMFAQAFHPAMKYAAGPRRELGIRTVFNILGPLCNPAGADRQVLGVADPVVAEKLVHALQRLGSRHALVVHGQDGIDEVSVSAPTTIFELRDGRVFHDTLLPSEAGVATHSLEDLRGGTPEENAARLRAVLAGEPGPLRDFVLVNAAAALVAFDLAPTIRDGVRLAAHSIDSGAAREKLERFVEVTNRLA
ncbi:MAG TPA: anthranilate phosphoribosyltransferase [Dehalococcoidia bacterium]|nr:anthranilate phosphoribosyltransferase [Dehalococcoidia bacterium]